jgi:SAM-dependent methyltransferase
VPGGDAVPAGGDRVPGGPPVENRWLAETGGSRGPEYAARFAALADEGADVHGEARFLQALLAPGSEVVDAGCGTGRIAIELARRGHRTHGIDLDASMLDQARSAAPQLRWTRADLLDVDAPDRGPRDRSGGTGGRPSLDRPADLVVAAGNVMVYLTPGTETAVVAHLAGWLRPGGLLVVGFAADRHVAPGDHDRWCLAAGLVPVAAHTAWDPAAPAPDAGSEYAVLVHRRPLDVV